MKPNPIKTVTKELPTEGQFVAVWEYNNLLWSQAYKYIDDKLFWYNLDTGEWEYPRIELPIACDTVYLRGDKISLTPTPDWKDKYYKCRKYLRDANRGAEINAKINDSLLEKNLTLTEENKKLHQVIRKLCQTSSK